MVIHDYEEEEKVFDLLIKIKNKQKSKKIPYDDKVTSKKFFPLIKS